MSANGTKSGHRLVHFTCPLMTQSGHHAASAILSSLRTLARFSLVAELMKGTENWNTWRRAFNFGCGASGR